MQTIKRHSGQDVAGWLAPAISSSETFLDLLPEFGIKYTVDMVPDDQPLPVKVRSGRLITMPYSTEINDIWRDGRPRLSGRQMGRDDEGVLRPALSRRAKTTAWSFVCRFIRLSWASRIAFRRFYDVLQHVTSHDGVWLATAGEIADWYFQHHFDEAVRHRASAKALRV